MLARVGRYYGKIAEAWQQRMCSLDRGQKDKHRCDARPTADSFQGGVRDRNRPMGRRTQPRQVDVPRVAVVETTPTTETTARSPRAMAIWGKLQEEV